MSTDTVVTVTRRVRVRSPETMTPEEVQEEAESVVRVNGHYGSFWRGPFDTIDVASGPDDDTAWPWR